MSCRVHRQLRSYVTREWKRGFVGRVADFEPLLDGYSPAKPRPLAPTDSEDADYAKRHVVEIAATSLMMVMLAAAIVTDLRTGKVYNKLTVPCAVAGLALGAITGGWPGLADRALGAGLVLAVVVMLSAAAGLGGGDAKLLIAVGALKGFNFAIWALLLTGVFGGLVAAAVMLRRRAVKQTAVNLIANMLSSAGGVPTDLAAGSAVGKIPYSIAIALGALAALALGA